MPHLAHEKRIGSANSRSGKAGSKPFQGFAAPTSNTTYTPNQFFDVCLPYSSRGVVRLVAYMIRKTLGWCDPEGNPQEERVAVSYQDLVTHAGISRDMIRAALDEAIAHHFILCVRAGRSRASGDSGETALYELAWDDSPEYVKDPKRFRGFFEAEGNRTDIPNEFFDRLIPRESLAVIKTVGAVIRTSIGFQARRGVRRQHSQLSYAHIQRYARIRSASTLSAALRTALNRNYIVRLEEGVFDVNAGHASRAAVYAVKWADSFGARVIGQKIEAAQNQADSDHRSENRSGIGQKVEAAGRSENRSGIETKQGNDTFKQQEPADAESRECFELLRKQGFDPRTAHALATKSTRKGIEDQIRWLALRNPARNAMGMLRKAIEENWPDPTGSALRLESPGAMFASHFYAALAGNDSQPAAEPSANEAAIAERFMQKLKSAEQGEVDPADWGRAFGLLVREDFPAATRDGFSLALALRLRGDGFYLRHTAALKAKRVKAERAAREAHEAEHHPAWIAYLKTEAERVKEERPADYARFQAHRADERRRMIESPWAVFTEERLARYDGEDRRVLDLQKFFASEVHDFWEWDALMNPNPFTPLPAATPTTP